MDEELTPEEARLLEREDRADERTPVWLVFIFGPLLASLAAVLWQSFHWLRYGDWPEASLRVLGFEAVHTSWRGLQNLIYWAVEVHLSVWLVPISMLATFLFTRNDNKPVPEALRSARAKRARNSLASNDKL